MAIYRKGADPVALRSAAERLTAHARECESVRGEAARALGAIRGQWGGGDLEHLMSRWPPVDAQLTQFGSELGRLAEALRRNAGQQDATSGSGGSGAVPLGGAGGTLPAGTPGAGGAGGGKEDDGVLDGIATGMTIFGLPSLVAQTAAYSSIARVGLVKTALMDGRYLANITEMMKTGDRMLELFPTSSRFAAGANMVADAWDMKGLSGLFAEGSAAGKAVGKFGVLGPVGIGLSAAQLTGSIAEGDTRGIVENGLGTGLAVGAVFAPPPFNIACGVAGLGLWAYQNVPGLGDFVDETAAEVGHAVAEVGDAVGDAASDAWDSVTSLF